MNEQLSSMIQNLFLIDKGSFFISHKLNLCRENYTHNNL